MKISVYLRNAFGLLFLLTLLACQDHQVIPGTPNAPRFRLKKTTIAGTSYYSENVYMYNSAGKLISYATQSNGGGGFSRTTLLTYDSQGRLTTRDLQSAPGRTDIRLTYTYDETGNITTITEYNDAQRTGNLFLERTTSLIYNTDKLPTKVTIVSGSRIETALYTYANGNVIRSERTFAPGTTSPQIINYQHDDKPNPFYGLLIDAPNPEAINRNNILYDGSERAYNSQGLLVNMNTNVKGAAIDKVRYSYEYEAY